MDAARLLGLVGGVSNDNNESVASTLSQFEVSTGGAARAQCSVAWFCSEAFDNFAFLKRVRSQHGVRDSARADGCSDFECAGVAGLAA